MNEYADTPERSEIAEETDTEQLLDWHEDALDLLDTLKAQLSAWKVAGCVDPAPGWSMRAQSKAGYAATTLKRIERRMIALGMDLPLTVEREEREQIRHLTMTVKKLRYECISAGIDISHIK